MMFRVKHERALKKAVDLGRTYLRLEGLSEGEMHEETLEIGEGGYGQLRVAVRIDLLENWRPSPSLVQSSVLNWVFPSLTSLPTRRLRNFRVFLNSTEFAPGDIVRGTIVLAASRPTSLSLRLYGRQTCRVSLIRTTSTKTMRWPHHATYSFFDSTIQLLSENDLSLGMKVFPFEFQLPAYLPSSGKHHVSDPVSLGLHWDGSSIVDYGLEVISKELGSTPRLFTPALTVKSRYAPSPRILAALSKLGPNPRDIKPFYPVVGKRKRKLKEAEIANNEIQALLDAPLSMRLGDEMNLKVTLKNSSPQTTVHSITVFLDQYNWFVSHNARWVPFAKKKTVQTWRLTPENCKVDSTTLPAPPGATFQAVLRAHLDANLPPTLPEQISPLCHIVYFWRVVVETGPVAGEVVLRFDIPVYIAASDDSFSNSGPEERPLLNGFWPCNPCFLPTFHRQWGEPSTQEYSERPNSHYDRRVEKEVPQFPPPSTSGRLTLHSSTSAINVGQQRAPMTSNTDFSALHDQSHPAAPTGLQVRDDGTGSPTERSNRPSFTSVQPHRGLGSMSLRNGNPRPRRGRESNVFLGGMDFINENFRNSAHVTVVPDSTLEPIREPNSQLTSEATTQYSEGDPDSRYTLVLTPPPEGFPVLSAAPASPTPFKEPTSFNPEDKTRSEHASASPVKPPASVRRAFPVPPPRSQRIIPSSDAPLSTKSIDSSVASSMRIRQPTPTRMITRVETSPLDSSASPSSEPKPTIAENAAALSSSQSSLSPEPLQESRRTPTPPNAPSHSPSLLDRISESDSIDQTSRSSPTLAPLPTGGAVDRPMSPTKTNVPKPPDSVNHDYLLKSFYGLATEKPRVEVVEKYSKALKTGGRYLFAPILIAVVPEDLIWRFIFPDPKLFDLYTEIPLRGWKRTVIGDTQMILSRADFAGLPKHNWTDDECEGGMLYDSRHKKIELSQLDHFTPSRDTVFEVATSIGAVDLDLQPDPQRDIMEVDPEELEKFSSFDESPAPVVEIANPRESAEDAALPM